MTESKHAMEFFEAYMTNVCNFNCVDCNRLNNYKFAGHYLWENVNSDYQRWSEKIEPKFINILGGEPFLNLDLPNWITGIRKLWPDTGIILLSNGSCLDLQKDVYNLLKDNRVRLDIGLHDRSRYDSVVEQIKNLLVRPITENFSADMNNWNRLYNQLIKKAEWPNCSTWEDFFTLPEHIQKECTEVHKINPLDWRLSTGSLILTDTNGVTVTIGHADYFFTAPLKYTNNDKFITYNSDPVAAHQVCISKYCAEMVDGKLHKCHHVALLPKFLKQYQVDIGEQDKDLLMSYQPLESTASDGEIQKFLSEIRNPIPQCKLCPDKLERRWFTAGTDKLKVKKIFAIKSESFGI